MGFEGRQLVDYNCYDEVSQSDDWHDEYTSIVRERQNGTLIS